MREMKDSGVEWIGEIPADWQVRKIKHLATLAGRIGWQGLTSNEYSDEGVYLITGVNFYNGKIDWQSCVHVPEYRWEEAKQIQIKNGDLLITKDGTIGKVAIVENMPGKTSLNSGVLLVRNNDECDTRFLYWMIQSDIFWRWFGIINAGNSTILHLYQQSFYNFSFPFPLLLQQKKIVEFLDSNCKKIDEIIEKQQAIIEKLKEYKLSIITEAVTKGLNPDVEMKESGAEFVGKIPQNWSIAKLGNLFDFIGGYAFNSEMYVSESQNQVVRIGNVKNGYMLLDSNPVFVNDETAEQANKFLIKPNHILFTMTGTKGKRDYFFTHVVTDEDCKGKRLYVNQRVGCFVAKKGVHPAYYGYLLKDNKILDGIFLYETGTANQGNLGIDSISRTKVHVPPYEEQIEISEYLCKRCRIVDKSIEARKNVVNKLQEYKKSLIYEVVTGKKEV